jgi:hypothetical protein
MGTRDGLQFWCLFFKFQAIREVLVLIARSFHTFLQKEPLGEEVRVPVEYKFKNPSFSEAITDLKVFVQGMDWSLIWISAYCNF